MESNKKAIYVEDVLELLSQGNTREEIRVHYDITKKELDHLFSHEDLKGKKPASKVNIVILRKGEAAPTFENKEPQNAFANMQETPAPQQDFTSNAANVVPQMAPSNIPGVFDTTAPEPVREAQQTEPAPAPAKVVKKRTKATPPAAPAQAFTQETAPAQEINPAFNPNFAQAVQQAPTQQFNTTQQAVLGQTPNPFETGNINPFANMNANPFAAPEANNAFQASTQENNAPTSDFMS